MQDKQWGELNRLDNLDKFEGLLDDFMANHAEFYK